MTVCNKINAETICGVCAPKHEGIQFSKLTDLDIMNEILHNYADGLGKIIERSKERMSKNCKRDPEQIPLQSRPRLSLEEHRMAEEKLRLENRLKEIEERLSMIEGKKWYQIFR